jgi:hypothetical protein
MKTFARQGHVISVWASLLIVLLACHRVSGAGDLFVDQANPQADDKNPGTLAAPFKTIQAAMDKAQPGDTVQVRGGVYREYVRFKRGGSYAHGAIFDPQSSSDIQWLTLEAYKDEHVILEGAVTLPAGQWQLVEGRKNTYWTPFVTAPYDDRQVNQVFRDGTLIMPTLKNVPGANSSQINGTVSNIVPVMPDDTAGDEGWFHDLKQKKLFVNMGGRVPGKDVEVKVAKMIEGVDAQSVSYARVRRLEVRDYVQSGIVVCRGHEFVVEDNYVHHCGNGIWGSPTSGGVIRRNTFTDIMGTTLGLGGARGTIVEENVVLRSHLNPYKIVAWSGPAIICNGPMGLVVRNNIVADCHDAAVWEDCYGLGFLLYGNTMHNLDGDGFYIEAEVRGTVLQWNTVYDSGSGIGFRQNRANVAFENYFFHNGRGIGIGTCDAFCPVKADAVMYNWLIDNGMGSAFGPDCSNEPAQIFDHNVYKFQDWPDVDLRVRKPAATKIDKNVDVPLTVDNWPGTNLKGQFWARWTGAVKAQKDGQYKFYVCTHEFNGSRLSVDDKPVVRAAEAKVPPSSKEREFTVPLKAGEHQIMLEFYHGMANHLWKGCTLSWEPPGGAKAVVPPSVLFHREPGAADLQPGLKAEFFDIHEDPAPMDPTNKAVILQYGNKQYTDLPSLRADVGQEIHGKVVTEFDPASIGLVTFRVNGAKQSWKPMPMIGNPTLQRMEAFHDSSDAYFWKNGSFQGPEPYGWRGAGDGWNGQGCGYGSTTRGDGTGFQRQAFAASVKWDKGPFDDPTAIRKFSDDPAAIKDDSNLGLAFIQVASYPPDKTISAEGYGVWSVDLPTVDDAQIDLSLWVRAKKLKAAKPANSSEEKMAGKENGGLFVAAEFRDITGQNVTRQYLVGANDGDKAAGADWMTGDYLYKPLKGTVTAPKGARWFRMGFGLRNCTGWAAFNDVGIQTRPGTPEAEIKRVLPIDASKFAWTVCDLSGLLNRPLADESGSGGKVGWTDQGPLMDLRNFHAGDYTFNNVAFRVEKGNGCFIMKNKHRPSENLPEGGKVDLKGKADLSANNSKGTMADVLAFLHTGGWIGADVQEATYIIHYADGTKVEIPVIGGRNIIDWAAPFSRADDVKYDPALGLILPAVSVPSPQFVHVTVWMVLWKNPHPDKPIAALEVKGQNQDIPGLIAVSRGVGK